MHAMYVASGLLFTMAGIKSLSGVGVGGGALLVLPVFICLQ